MQQKLLTTSNGRMEWTNEMKSERKSSYFQFFLVKITIWLFCAANLFPDFAFLSFDSFSDRRKPINWTRERELLQTQSNRMIAQQFLFTFRPVFCYTPTININNMKLAKFMCGKWEWKCDSDGERWRVRARKGNWCK